MAFSKYHRGDGPAQADIVDHVVREAGIQSREAALAALVMGLEELGSMIPHPRRAAIAGALPALAAEPFGRRPYDSEFGVKGLLAGVAEGAQVEPGVAIEYLGAVLTALREELSQDLWRIFVSELPDDVAALVPAVRSSKGVHSSRSPKTPKAPGPAHLAGGRPGSAHPVADAASDPRAHAHSMAKTDDPHADTKLSEAKGLTQGREHESLADGHPGADRTLADRGGSGK